MKKKVKDPNIAIRVESHVIKPPHPLYKLADDLCFKSKNLYNSALYAWRQSYFAKEKGLIPYELSIIDIINLFTDTRQPDYVELPAKISQSCIRKLGDNIKSFYGLKKSYKDPKGEVVNEPSIPGYLHKTDGRMVVEFNKQAVLKSIKTNEIILMKRSKKPIRMKIQAPVTSVIGARISGDKRRYKLEVIYEVKVPEFKSGALAAIDLGIENLLTIASTVDHPKLVKGGRIKSINNYFNKRIAKKQSALPEGVHTSKAIHRLWDKRADKLKHEFHCITRKVVDYFDEMGITKVVIGKNSGWKKGLSLGDTTQHFAYIPYNMLINQLIYKCQDKGIEVLVKEESYTSKASFLDEDLIPVFNTKHNKPEFSGKRISRGLYKAINVIFNADVNASYNIMVKHFGNVLDKQKVLLTPTIM